MHLTILAAMTETVNQTNYYWLVAAALPLALLVSQKNKKRKKLGFFKRFLLKLMLRKKYKADKGTTVLRVILALGLATLSVIFLGWVLGLIIGLLILGAATNESFWD